MWAAGTESELKKSELFLPLMNNSPFWQNKGWSNFEAPITQFLANIWMPSFCQASLVTAIAESLLESWYSWYAIKLSKKNMEKQPWCWKIENLRSAQLASINYWNIQKHIFKENENNGMIYASLFLNEFEADFFNWTLITFAVLFA